MRNELVHWPLPESKQMRLGIDCNAVTFQSAQSHLGYCCNPDWKYKLQCKMLHKGHQTFTDARVNFQQQVVCCSCLTLANGQCLLETRNARPNLKRSQARTEALAWKKQFYELKINPGLLQPWVWIMLSLEQAVLMQNVETIWPSADAGGLKRHACRAHVWRQYHKFQMTQMPCLDSGKWNLQAHHCHWNQRWARWHGSQQRS